MLSSKLLTRARAGLFLSAALTSFASSAVLAADPVVSFSAGSYTKTGLGDEIGSGLDTFSITGNTVGGLSVSGATTADIGSYAFVVGVNCITCSLTPSFVAPITLDVAGYGTQTIDVPYTWSSIKTEDFLTFGKIAPMVFTSSTLPALDFVFKPLPVMGSSGTTVTGNLVASISAVPEPSTYAMLIAGLGLLTFAARRKARSSF